MKAWRLSGITIALLLTVVLLASTLACGTSPPPATTAPAGKPAAPQTFKWKLSFHAAKSSPYANTIQFFADEMDKRTDGRVKTQVFFSQELVGLNEALEAVQSGLADIAAVAPSFIPGKLPLANIVSLPGLGPLRGDQWALAYYELAKTPLLVQEFDKWNAVFAFSGHTPGYSVVGGKTPVRSLEDLKGKRIRVMGADMGVPLKQFGAVPMVVPLPEVYTALDTRLIDLVAHSRQNFYTLKWYEATKYLTSGVNVGRASLLFLMNKNSWNALPNDIKGVFENLRPEIAKFDFEQYYEADFLKKIDDAYKAAGIEDIRLSADESAKIVAASKPAWDEWVKKVGEDKGRKVLDDFLAISEKVVAKYPGKPEGQ